MISYNEFKEKWGFLENKKVFVACSGGVDSIVLSYLVGKFCKNVTLLHVNYHLRGNDSNLDENFVRNFSEKHQFKFFLKSYELGKYLKKNTGNLQKLAREIRYNWFHEFLKDDNCYLLLAHHLDDQVETFYLNLARKSGIFGLSCMLEVERNKLRPLINYSKNEILIFAKTNNLSWREDVSNQSNKYRRNLIRNQIIPFLESKIPSFKNSVLVLIHVFQENRKEIESNIYTLFHNIKTEKKLPVETWKNLTEHEKIYLLSLFEFSNKQVREIEKILLSENGKIIHTKNYTFRKENDFLCLIEKEKQISQLNIPKIIIEAVTEIPKVFNKTEIYIDAAKVFGDLKIRFWNKNDTIHPIGMHGSQKISKIIKDSKVDARSKNDVLVIYDDKEIIWCYGLKISKNYVAKENSGSILKISLEFTS